MLWPTSQFFKKIFQPGKYQRQKRLLEMLVFCRNIASRLFSLYLPLFLFDLAPKIRLLNQFFPNFSHIEKGLFLIGVYYLIFRTVALLTSITGARCSIKYGYQRGLFLGAVLYGFLIIILTYSLNNPHLVFLAAIFHGLHTSVYWSARHTVISKFFNKSKMAKSLGLIRFLQRLASVIAPVVGALVISWFGYQYLFLAALVFVFLLIVISLQLEVGKERDRIGLKEFFAWLKEKRFGKLLLTVAGRYMNDINISLWPLYVFLLLGDIKSVGILYSISLFVAMVISLFAGGILDKQKTKKPYFFSGSILSGLWLCRMLVFNPLTIALADTTHRIFSSFHWLFYDKVFVSRGKGKEALSYFVYREITIAAAAIIFWSLFLIVFLVHPIGWKALFALGAVGVLLTLLIEEKEAV